MKINSAQNMNQNVRRTGSFKAVSSPFGKDGFSKGVDKPDGNIDPSKFREFFNTGGSFRVAWRHKAVNSAGGDPRGVMTAKDGSLFSAVGGKFEKLDPESGRVLWARDFGKDGLTVHSKPAVEGKDGTVFVKTSDKVLRALDPKNGKEKWNFQMNQGAYRTEVGPDGTIYARREGNLVALDPNNGKEKYSFELDDFYHYICFADKDGSLNVSSSRGVHALNGDGSVKWHAPGTIVKRFYTDPDRVYTAHNNWVPDPEKKGPSIFNELIQMRDAETGEKKWEQNFERAHVCGSVNNRVFVRQPDKISALNAETGDFLWTRDGYKKPEVKLVGDDGSLYVANEKKLSALDPKTGKERWSFNCGEPDNTPALITSEGVLLISDKNTIFGVNPEKGEVLFKQPMEDGITGFMPSKDGKKVFVSSGKSGEVFAIDLRTSEEIAEDLRKNPEDNGDKKEIKVKDSYVDVGGVKLPRRKGD